MGRILKSYIFWTYERGSFHYDVMVTLILAFIFITPHVLDYHDHPTADNLPPSEILVRPDGPGKFIYELPSEQVKGAADAPFNDRLEQSIESISGPVVIDHYDKLKDASGRVAAYKVWAHR